MIWDTPEPFLPNAHTLQTQFNCFAQYYRRFAAPDTEAQHDDSRYQQRGLHQNPFYMAQFHHPFVFSANIIAQES